MKPRERRLLRFVQAFKATHDNLPPTLAEVGAGVGIRNEERLRRLLGNLIERGQLAANTVADGGASGGGGGGGGEQN
jgi:hypothetical protein